MRRNVLIACGLLAVVVLAAAVVALTAKRPEWTTSSPAALAEFQKGLDANEKVYYDEARAHFAKAMEIDPNFIMAKYFLTESSIPRAPIRRRRSFSRKLSTRTCRGSRSVSASWSNTPLRDRRKTPRQARRS